MKKNWNAILSLVLVFLPLLAIPMQGMLSNLVQPAVNTSSLAAEISKTAETIKLMVNLMCALWTVGIIFGVFGLLTYNKNASLGGKGLSIMAIVLNSIAALSVLAIYFMSSNIGSMVGDMVTKQTLQ